MTRFDLMVGSKMRRSRFDRGGSKGSTSEDRARLAELEREIAKLQMERDQLRRTTAARREG